MMTPLLLLHYTCHVCWNNIAPVCYNTTYCGGESVGDNLLSYEQCCFELSGVSFASSGQCVLCPKSGMFFLIIIIVQITSNLNGRSMLHLPVCPTCVTHTPHAVYKHVTCTQQTQKHACHHGTPCTLV